MLRPANWTDEEGRKWRTLLPDGVDPANAEDGIPVGPPPLDDLGLPAEVAVRLHNELFDRGLFSLADIRRDRTDGVTAAIKAAYKLDVGKVLTLYRASETREASNNGQSQSPAGKSVSSLHTGGRRRTRD